MCSWCYGFAPAITAIAERFEDRMPLQLVMGGLRAGNTAAMRPQDKDYIRDAWTRVGAATGQPSDFSFLDREGFVYDTEPACRAVVTAPPAAAPRAPLHGPHPTAFYAEGRDMTSAEEIAEVADEGRLRPRRVQPPSSPETATRPSAISSPPRAGHPRLPTLIAGQRGQGYAPVTNGYRPLEDVLEPLERWWAAGAPVTAAAQ
jgi:putative protein-disulfide isomerase